jgi:hypothetical protein
MRADTHRGPERNRSTSEAEYIDAALTFALSDSILPRTAGPYIWHEAKVFSSRTGVDSTA